MNIYKGFIIARPDVLSYNKENEEKIMPDDDPELENEIIRRIYSLRGIDMSDDYDCDSLFESLQKPQKSKYEKHYKKEDKSSNRVFVVQKTISNLIIFLFGVVTGILGTIILYLYDVGAFP